MTTIKDVSHIQNKKGAVYDEIEISQMDYNEETRTFSYPCPCGDLFLLTEDQIADGEDIARCPSCSLIIRVLYQVEYEDEEE